MFFLFCCCFFFFNTSLPFLLRLYFWFSYCTSSICIDCKDLRLVLYHHQKGWFGGELGEDHIFSELLVWTWSNVKSWPSLEQIIWGLVNNQEQKSCFTCPCIPREKNTVTLPLFHMKMKTFTSEYFNQTTFTC